MGTGARREKERRARLEAVLDAAQELFDTRGFEATSVDDIADRCELSKGTVYNYCTTKKEILAGLRLRNLAALRRQFEEVTTEIDDPGERLVALGRTFGRFVRATRHTLRPILAGQDAHMMEGVSPEVASRIAEAEGALFATVWQAIQDGVDRGLFRQDIDSTKMTLGLWGAAVGIHAVTATANRNGLPVEADAVAEEFLRFIPRGVLR